MDIALATLGAYLLGSVSFAIVVSKLLRLPDPRSYGSKNPGATRVTRKNTPRMIRSVPTTMADFDR